MCETLESWVAKIARQRCNNRRDATRASGIAIILRDGGSATDLMPGAVAIDTAKRTDEVLRELTLPCSEPTSKRHRLGHLPARHDPWRLGAAELP